MPALELDVNKNIVLSEAQFRLFQKLIYERTGISLGTNKLEFVQSRLRVCLRNHDLQSYKEYYRLLMDCGPNSDEMQEMINRVTTNKTHFLRELHHFEYLQDVVFPRVIQEAKEGKRKKEITVWCAAASSGEEPYSLAIFLRDKFENMPGWNARVLATDIDTKVLEQADEAKYVEGQLLSVGPEMLRRHFRKEGDLHQVRDGTKKYVTFRQLNLLDSQWPMSVKFDAIFCRNVLIYFDQPTQNKVMSQMAQHLHPLGSMFIGHSESLSPLEHIYRRVGKTVYHLTGSGNAPVSQSRLQKTKVDSPQPAPNVHTNAGSAARRALTQRKIVVGEMFASDTPAEISTVLGSCVAVCLFDLSAGVGGMNHYALPTGKSTARKQGCFGDHAMQTLLKQVMDLGANPLHLQAKAFGGADVLGLADGTQIGQRNMSFIRDFLKAQRIPLVSEYLGGERGMNILFQPHSGRARVKLIDREEVLKIEDHFSTAGPAPHELAEELAQLN